jgi:glutathione S-transferase
MNDRLPILYSFIRCPYAIRARLALCCAKTVYELREVRLKDKPVSLLEYSPKGTVPVLILPDRTVIEQSLDIMFWALEKNNTKQNSQYTNQPLLSLSGKDKEYADYLIKENDGNFKYALDRYKYPNRYANDENQNSTSLEWRNEAEKFLKELENQLNPHAYLFGDQLSYADLALMPFVRQFAKVDPEWFCNSPYKQLNNWLNKIEQSDLFETVIRKYEPWKPECFERIIIK